MTQEFLSETGGQTGTRKGRGVRKECTREKKDVTEKREDRNEGRNRTIKVILKRDGRCEIKKKERKNKSTDT